MLLVAVALLLVLPAAAEDKGKKKTKVADLPERWRVWLQEEVYPLVDSVQKDAFLALETEAQRLEYAERLWALWGRQTGIGAQFRSIYQERLELCRSEFETTTSDRARVLLLHGPPEGRVVSNCPTIFHPLDIWYWSYLEGLGEDIVVLFYQPGGLGSYILWHPMSRAEELYTYVGWQAATQAVRTPYERVESLRCPNGDELLRMIEMAKRSLRDTKVFSCMHHMPRMEQHGAESASNRFMEFSALLPDRHDPLDFAVSDMPRATRGGKVLMGFSIKVPSADLGTTTVGDVKISQLDVVGEISQSARMVDRFRYLFTVPTGSDELALLLERSIRPGDYQIRIKVEDAHSRRAGVKEAEFTARPPTAEELAALAASRQEALAEAVTEVAVDDSGEDESNATLLLVGPEGDGVSGLQRFEAFVGPGVERVTFLLDGDEILTKNRPPFDVDLDLGPLPRLRTVTAVAYDTDGIELDRKQLSLNVGRERYYVRLQPFGPGSRRGSKLLVEVEVNIPGDKTLDRLEVYWNELLLAQLFQEPFAAWVDLGAGSKEFGYLRALAIAADGSQAEDIQFVNAPRFGDVVDVTAIELPVSVLDRSNDPIENLTVDDFTVLEDGVEQQITQCSLHRDLPIRLGIVIDTSGSMEETLPEVQRVVMGFLRDFVRPRDRAFIEIFSDIPEVLTPFTADFATLENALLALFPDRSTALYDAIIVSLFEFSGVRGRRTMVVLTDGADTISEHTYQEAIDYAQRRGITIYTIGIGIKATEVVTRHQLSNLAQVTGGRAFFLDEDARLQKVYDTINRELRTQYLLAYTSSSEAPADELRKIKVKVNRRGAKVRTLAGYYPNSR